jgi:hypothetical protein
MLVSSTFRTAAAGGASSLSNVALIAQCCTPCDTISRAWSCTSFSGFRQFQPFDAVSGAEADATSSAVLEPAFTGIRSTPLHSRVASAATSAAVGRSFGSCWQHRLISAARSSSQPSGIRTFPCRIGSRSSGLYMSSRAISLNSVQPSAHTSTAGPTGIFRYRSIISGAR